MKGQIQFTNLLILFITVIVLIFLVPILQQAADQSATALNENPNPQTSFTIMLMYLLPAALFIGIILTIMNYAIPKREGYY